MPLVFINAGIAAPLALAGESMPLWLRCVLLGIEAGTTAVIGVKGRPMGSGNAGS